jgi:flagellar motor switch protein FliM
MSVLEYDFRQPPPSSLETKVRDWLAEYFKQLGRTWPDLLCIPTSLELQEVVSLPSNRARERISEMDYAYILPITKDDQGEQWTLVTSRPVLLALVSSILGEIINELPKDRPFTMIEEGLLSLVCDQLFLSSIPVSWPFDPRPLPRVLQRGMVHLALPTPTNDLMIVIAMKIKFPFTEENVVLYVPRGGIVLDLQKAATTATAAALPVQDQMVGLVKEMAVDVEVNLGSVELTYSQLGKLQIGDLLVLDQRVNQPLEASVGGLNKFQVWPGAIGKRQAIQIDSPLV